MRATVLALPGNAPLAARLVLDLPARMGRLEVRRFPDGETYVRIGSPVAGRPVVIAATLDRPDEKLIALSLAAATARELGATAVGLVAPYLPYLRQDRRFRSGEALSAKHFARLLSGVVDWVVTVDPHLHRVPDLGGLYAIPAESVTAASRIAQWVREHVQAPVLVGPDEESRQWVGRVADEVGAPVVTLLKRRLGDREVCIELPDLAPYRGRTPVLVDDIVSTGRTLIEAARGLAKLGLASPWCIAVHGIFAGGAYGRLQAAGMAGVVTCNTVRHPSNAIEVHDLLTPAAAHRLAEAAATSGGESW
ncbi:MAG: ribose-phosphate pyrophosphokinase [Gemmatimonadales bacterium]